MIKVLIMCVTFLLLYVGVAKMKVYNLFVFAIICLCLSLLVISPTKYDYERFWYEDV